MGTLVVYVLEWALCQLIFLTVYKLCFSGSTLHRFNRWYLMGSVAVSMLLPLIHVQWTEMPQLSIEQTALVRVLRSNQLQADGERTVMLPNVDIRPQDESSRIWAGLLVTTYIIYIVMLLVGWGRSTFKMIRFMKGKRMYRLGRMVRLVVHDEQFGPFNWLNYVVVPSSDTGFSRRASICHELSHIRKMHSVDLVVLLLCTIVNPVCWLVMKEIKIVHEYEADDEVIGHYHIECRDYQRLLIYRTVGAEAYALASSFNLNIKKRIIMMKKQQTSRWRTLWLLAAIPAAGIALTAFAASPLADSISDEGQAGSNSVFTPRIVQQAVPAETAEDAMDEVVAEPDATDEVVADDDDPLRLIVTGQLAEAPLIVIDRQMLVMQSSPSDMAAVFKEIGLTNDDVQTLTVLKDEAATAIWGDKGKNGVIEVVTKSKKYAAKVEKLNEANADAMVSDEDAVFDVVEEMPEFDGGMAALMQYLAQTIKYPELAKDMGVQGRVVVRFEIDKAGNVCNAQAINSVDPERKCAPSFTDEQKAEMSEREIREAYARYDKACAQCAAEAVRVISSMPKWKPGKQRGKAVRVNYNVPISFRLR